MSIYYGFDRFAFKEIVNEIINEYEVGNFKSISQKANIPLKPITLIFGPNSSGKSAIIQSLLMLKQTLTESTSKQIVLLSNGSLVDLGAYSDFISNNDKTKHLKFSVVFKFPKDKESNNFIPGSTCDNYSQFQDRELPEKYEFLETLINNFTHFKLSIDICQDQSDSKINISEIRIYLGESEESFGIFEPQENGYIQDQLYGLTYKNIHPFYELFFDRIRASEDVFKDLLEKLHIKEREFDNTYEKKCALGFILSCLFFLQEPEYCPGPNNRINHFLPEDAIVERTEYAEAIHPTSILAGSAGLCFELFLKNLVYLGPFRQLPERYYRVSGDMPVNVGRSGEWMPQILYHDPEKLANLNAAMKRFEIPYELKVSRLKYVDSQGNEETCIKQSDIFALRMLNKRNGVEASIRDVGFGYSQLLPIIMQSILSQKEFIIIEQPELHLHPAMQVELGDLFINSALGENKNKFLIETHSEHLILRLLRRIRETTAGELPENVSPIHPEDIAVLYVEPGEDGSVVKEMKVDKNGEFIDWWPAGFFTERADELF
ncbi:MAG: AAA family ATPase [Candidatus Omnitrophota bacterium]